MKKSILFVMFLLFAVIAVNAQYSVNKSTYDAKSYSYKFGDPFNTTVSGVASLFIPGLGQMISGEGGRGTAFLGGYAGCWVVYGVGVGMMATDIDEDSYYDGSGAGAVAPGVLGTAVVNIWSIFDAVKITKINNLA